VKSDDLYKMADTLGVRVCDHTFPVNGSLSVVAESGACYVMIDTQALRTEAVTKVHLAHELGHCLTRSFYNRYSRYDIRARHERKADKAAIKMLVPFADYTAALRRGVTTVWELAEHFDVTEDFMRKVVPYYAEDVARQQNADQNTAQ
jgi:Zn-dependent peptidase ImmA (M78 family)